VRRQTADERERLGWVPGAVLACYGALPADDTALRYYIERQLDEALLPAAPAADRGHALAALYAELPPHARDSLARLLRDKHR
jgi:hypothetical protein